MRVFPRSVSTSVAIALLLAALAPRAHAVDLDPARFVSVDELRPGDRCVGRTVFSGNEIEEFDVEIVGIVRNVSPGSDLIIGRAHDETLDRTGILQGMSGSPVYLDGRLVGAISATWPFTKEPLAGITPIGEMLPALDGIDAAPGERHGSEPDGFGAALYPPGEYATSRIGWIAGLAGRGDRPDALPARGVLGSYGGRDMTALASPLVVGGGDERFLARVGEILGDAGYTPVLGVAGAQGAAGGPLEPGSAVGVQFVSGDLNWTAIGTVTYREGDRLLAFGHPLFNAGTVEVPMVGASVHALVPLLSVSFKMATGGALAGTFRQDRRRMVGGVVGVSPDMLPLHVTVREEGYAERTFDFEVVRARPYSSVFAGMAVAGAFSEALRASGPSSVELEMSLDAAGDVVEYGAVFYTTDPAFRVGGEAAAFIDFVQGNAFEKRDVSSVSLDVTVTGGRRTAVIERVAP